MYKLFLGVSRVTKNSRSIRRLVPATVYLSSGGWFFFDEHEGALLHPEQPQPQDGA